MNAHRRCIDHLYLAIIGLGDGLHQAIPNTGFAPAIKPIVAACVTPISIGQIPPRRIGSQDLENSIEDAASTLGFTWLQDKGSREDPTTP
jgi:hypothetical protein